jgi:hypothetical protein
MLSLIPIEPTHNNWKQQNTYLLITSKKRNDGKPTEPLRPIKQSMEHEYTSLD